MSLRISGLCAALLIMFVSVCRLDAAAVARWSFDSSPGGNVVPDEIGSVNGTLSGDAAFVSGGISGNAVAMTSLGNGLVDMGNNFGFTGNQTFTIQAWVKTSVMAGNIVVSKHVAGFTNGYWLGLNNTNDGGVNEPIGSFKFYQSDSNSLNSGNSAINNDTWHQLVGVHDGVNNHIRIYLDGTRVPLPNSTDPLNSIGANTAPFSVGGIISAGNLVSAYTGLVDEVWIWDHALTDEEVSFYFNNPTGVPEPSSIVLLGLSALGMLVRRR